MSTVKASNVQFGNAADTMNFTWSTPTTPDGTIKLMRGSADGASLQDLLTVDASNNLYLPTGTAPTKSYTDKSTALATTAHVYNHRATAKAWVVFRPASASILTQHNISAVTRAGPGQYLITMNTANINSGFGFNFNTSYTVIGNCGQDEVGNTTPLGYNNILFSGGRSQSAFYVYTWEVNNQSFEDAGIVTLAVFGA